MQKERDGAQREGRQKDRRGWAKQKPGCSLGTQQFMLSESTVQSTAAQSSGHPGFAAVTPLPSLLVQAASLAAFKKWGFLARRAGAAHKKDSLFSAVIHIGRTLLSPGTLLTPWIEYPRKSHHSCWHLEKRGLWATWPGLVSSWKPPLGLCLPLT